MAGFQRPRILSDRELNVIRGKCLLARASNVELMQMIGHFDLVEQKLRAALETLAGCLPSKVYVSGAYGDQWSDTKPDRSVEYEVIDFKELLGHD